MKISTTIWIVFLGLISLAASGDPLTLQDKNKARITKNYALINEGHWREVIEVGWQPWSKNHGYMVGPRMVEVLGDIIATFPDYRQEIIEIKADGNTVIVRAEVSGTWLGKGTKLYSFGGKEPNGKTFRVQQIHWYELEDYKVKEHRAGRDDWLMMAQLGLVNYHDFTRQPIPIIK